MHALFFFLFKFLNLHIISEGDRASDISSKLVSHALVCVCTLTCIRGYSETINGHQALLRIERRSIRTIDCLTRPGRGWEAVELLLRPLLIIRSANTHRASTTGLA